MIGSRLAAGARAERSWWRAFNCRVYNFLSRRLLGHDFFDLQCGFKAIRAETFKNLADLMKDDQWFFDTELVVWTRRVGYKIKEIPVNWQENRYAKRASRVKVWRDAGHFFLNLLALRRRLKAEPARSRLFNN